MLIDYFKITIGSLMKRKLRAWLTMIGIFIGIAAIVALISLGQGLQDAVTQQFELLGTDKIIIQPGGTIGAPGTGAQAAKLTDKEIKIVERTPGIAVASEDIIRIGKIEFNDRTLFNYFSGARIDSNTLKLWDEMGFMDIVEGRTIKQGDKRKVVVGYLLGTEDKYFGKIVKPGNKILIENEEFEVVGIMKRIGNEGDDTSIYGMIEDAEEIFNSKDKYDAIFAKVTSEDDINQIAEQIKKDIRKLRGEKEGEEDFSVQTAQELLESFGSILNIITAVLIGIAGISLIVGGIGIMNTMYTSVLERTNDIGIMKAIGAKNSDILTIFMIESGLLGFVGGIIGIVIGMSLGYLAAFVARQALATTLIQASFPWYLIVGALMFSLIVGMASGILPAIQASKLKPVESLRYE